LNDISGIISQLERQRTAIDRALQALRDIEGTGEPAPKKRGRKRRMSAEGRARIGEATRKRWAAKRAAEAAAGQKGNKPAKKRRGGKRTISAEGRARIAEAARRMWAAKKATKKGRPG
jgi:hypothetical protein